MSRLPQPGGDQGTWGDVLNDFLTQAHSPDGSLKTDSVGAAQLGPSAVAAANIADGTITNSKLDNGTQTSLAKADSAVQSVNGNTPTNGDLSLATSDLSDATISSPANGQVLTYDNTAGKWKNTAPASAPVASVVGQTGVVTGAMIAGDSALSGMYATLSGPPNTQTGITYTLALGDANKVVEGNNAAAVTVTVPPNSSVAFAIGSSVVVRQIGVGQVSVAAGVEVTIRSRGGSLSLVGQYSEATITKRSGDEWVLSGDLA